MMEQLMIVANVAIVFGVIYKLFELFVGRKERMMLIEKLPADMLADGQGQKRKLPSLLDLPASSSSLRLGCLLMGLGVGLLVGYCIVANTQPEYFMDDVNRGVRETVSIIYGASVLLGGGMGLVVAFLIEMMRASRGK